MHVFLFLSHPLVFPYVLLPKSFSLLFLLYHHFLLCKIPDPGPGLGLCREHDKTLLVIAATLTKTLPPSSFPERTVSPPHGDAGRPPQLRPAAAAPRGARG